MNERTKKRHYDQGDYPKFAIDVCLGDHIASSIYFHSLLELVNALPAIARQEAHATSLVIAEIDPATQTLDIIPQQH